MYGTCSRCSIRGMVILREFCIRFPQGTSLVWILDTPPAVHGIAARLITSISLVIDANSINSFPNPPGVLVTIGP